MAITAEMCREILTVERPYHRMRQRDWDMLLLFAQQWLDHEAQVASYLEEIHIWKQKSADANDVAATLRQQVAEAQEAIDLATLSELQNHEQIAILEQQVAELQGENERLRIMTGTTILQTSVGGLPLRKCNTCGHQWVASSHSCPECEKQLRGHPL